jgi:hypothetical protein
MLRPSRCAALLAFRHTAFACLGRRQDALFELIDAASCGGAADSLGWDRARVRSPKQMDRWTWVVLAAYTQLRLARGLIADQRLPWERPRSPEQLTPWRVLRGLGDLVRLLGTPASAPTPCGRSPGRPKGRCSGPAPRYPALKAAVARAAS